MLYGMAHTSFLPRVGVLAVVQHKNNLLLVKRANAPDAGLWGFPGGRVEAGETLQAAAARELHEETNLNATANTVLDTFDSLHYGPDGSLLFHYVIIAIHCSLTHPEQHHPTAGDDALEARWFSLQEICTLGPAASARVSALAHAALKVQPSTHTF